MEAVQNLMTQYWINKDRDRDLYTKTKREVNQMRHFLPNSSAGSSSAMNGS